MWLSIISSLKYKTTCSTQNTQQSQPHSHSLSPFTFSIGKVLSKSICLLDSCTHCVKWGTRTSLGPVSQTVPFQHILPSCSSLCQKQVDQLPSEDNLNQQSDFKIQCLLCHWQSTWILAVEFFNTGKKCLVPKYMLRTSAH